MPAFSEPSSTDDLPNATALGQLVSAALEAYVGTRPKDEALAFLRLMAHVLADRGEQASVVVNLRKVDRESAKLEAEANRKAVAMFRKMLEGCIARLLPGPDELDNDDT